MKSSLIQLFSNAFQRTFLINFARFLFFSLDFFSEILVGTLHIPLHQLYNFFKIFSHICHKIATNYVDLPSVDRHYCFFDWRDTLLLEAGLYNYDFPIRITARPCLLHPCHFLVNVIIWQSGYKYILYKMLVKQTI